MEEAKPFDPTSIPDAIGIWSSVWMEGVGPMVAPWVPFVLILVVSAISYYWVYRYGLSWKIVGFGVLGAHITAILFYGKLVPMLIKDEGMDYTHSTLIISFAAFFGLQVLGISLVPLAFVLVGLLLRKLVKRVPENTPV